MLRIAVQACQGLHSLHCAFMNETGKLKGVFHRDVKPENILIRRKDGLAKIADFGIAVALEGSGVASTTTGTLPYMAPELLEGSGADYRADIYSLGVTLYEMCSGRLPYNPLDREGRAKAPMVYGREICRGQAPHLCEVSQTERALGDIVMRALARRPKERYQDIGEIRQGLEGLRQLLNLGAELERAWAKPSPQAQEAALCLLVQQHAAAPEAYRNLAKFYHRRMAHDRAAQILEQGLVCCPGCAEMVFDLALALHKTGRAQRAVRLLEQALGMGLASQQEKSARRFLKLWRQ
jgi:serine/threonine protein kinase